MTVISFKQFILEQESISPEELAELVKKECTPYLSEVKNLDPEFWLKRGIENLPTTDYWFKQDTRVDRKPKDTFPQIHNFMDDFMLKHHGHRFRSNSLFCMSSSEAVGNYGLPYFVFPVGEFKYCWSEHVDDAYTFFDNMRYRRNPTGLKRILSTLAIEDYEYDLNNPLVWIDVLKRFFNEVDLYKTTGLTDALVYYSNNEIMVSCNSAYFLRCDKIDTSNFLNHLLKKD